MQLNVGVTLQRLEQVSTKTATEIDGASTSDVLNFVGPTLKVH
jgi:hypothetical protein